MAGTPLKIIVGLGNPGPEHLLTRHNAGFWFVDALAAKMGARFRSHTRFQGEICRTQLSGGEVTLLKPMTYMNRSGLAIRALVDLAHGRDEPVVSIHHPRAEEVEAAPAEAAAAVAGATPAAGAAPAAAGAPAAGGEAKKEEGKPAAAAGGAAKAAAPKKEGGKK